MARALLALLALTHACHLFQSCQGACPAGTYGVDAGLAPCFPCPRGTYASTGGLTACATCPPGFTTLQPDVTSQIGATQCEEACAAGFVGSFGLSPCSACPPGRFAARGTRPDSFRMPCFECLVSSLSLTTLHVCDHAQLDRKSVHRVRWVSFPSQASLAVRSAPPSASWRA